MSQPEVARIVPRGTVLCIGSGPSLTREDVDYCRGRVDASIAINTSYLMAPWATVLYACDYKWWRANMAATQPFPGLKFALRVSNNHYPPGVVALRNTGPEGLELRPFGLRTGQNSGYQAINLAVHLGASRIILLGYDMGVGQGGKTHWHDPHEGATPSPYATFRAHFRTIVEPLKACGVEVLNCSRRTALTAFPRVPLAEALPVAEAVAS